MSKNLQFEDLGRLLSEFGGDLEESKGISDEFTQKFKKLHKHYLDFEKRYLIATLYALYLEGSLDGDSDCPLSKTTH